MSLLPEQYRKPPCALGYQNDGFSAPATALQCREPDSSEISPTVVVTMAGQHRHNHSPSSTISSIDVRNSKWAAPAILTSVHGEEPTGGPTSRGTAYGQHFQGILPPTGDRVGHRKGMGITRPVTLLPLQILDSKSAGCPGRLPWVRLYGIPGRSILRR